jgi:VWFA-related protein
MRRVKVLPLVLLIAGISGAQSPSTGDDQQQPWRISTNVELVVLPAAVRDKKGLPVSSLPQENFQVYESGVLQSIRLFLREDIPVTVGLVVDHSGSMKQKLPEVVAAARAFVKSSNPDDQVFVINFNEKVSSGLPDSIPFSDNANELEEAIEKSPASGQTALYDAVSSALDRLKTGSHEKKALIVISDGGDNASLLGLPEVLKRVGESNAVVYAIGIFDAEDPDRNPNVLRNMARTTGGEAFFPDKLDEVVAICESIAADIRRQYTIGYVSSNSVKPGEYRAIHVVARSAGKDLVVRTRAGYIAGGDTPVNKPVKKAGPK